jgi:hypothetical protein
MANIKAYIPIEYIGPKRKMGDSKAVTRGYGTWFFCEKNKWMVKCPSDVADWCSQFPGLFKIHWDDDDKVAELAIEVKLLKEQLKEKKKPPAKAKE